MGRIFSDPATARFGAPNHPEAPFRVVRTAERLAAAGHNVEAPCVLAAAEHVSLLHGPKHFARVAAGDFSDADTPAYPGIAAIALISLSGALSAAEAAAQGAPSFSLMRPPGHHAGKDRVAGFCYFNNIALACQHLIKSGGAKKIALLDIDVHHGDGTEELLRDRDDVLFCSLHQAPLYPGTGLKSSGNCLNFPLPAGTGEKEYLETLATAEVRH